MIPLKKAIMTQDMLLYISEHEFVTWHLLLNSFFSHLGAEKGKLGRARLASTNLG